MVARIVCFLVSPCLGLVAAPASVNERDIAEWVIRSGGRVLLEGNRTPLTDISALPPGDLHVAGIDLTNTIIEPGQLKQISGLPGLRELYLPGPSWTPFSDSPLDANDALKYLAGLKNLQRLYFSLHFLPTYNIDDKGIALLAGITQLRELRLAQSRVATPDLTPFVHLTSLDLSDCTYFGDKGMKVLERLNELRRLYLRNTPVTDEGLTYISGLSQLEELDLYGVSVTDRGLESLRKLTGMRKLNLLGAAITDTGINALAGMTHLRELNLYRSRVTNAGLAKLEALRELRALDVRYTQVSDTGLDSFRAAIPACAIEFVGSVSKRTGAAGARPAGASEKAIADWIRAAGGRVELTSGQIRSISLASTGVGDGQLKYIGALDHLERLDLAGTEVGDLGMPALSSLTGLKELILNNTSVSDTGLAVLRGMHQLSALGLEGTLVRGSGLRNLERLTNLKDLDLASAPVRNEGLLQIGSIRSLERLILSYTDISDEGLVHLAGLPHLQVLKLEGTDVGDSGLANIGKIVTLRELALNSCRFTDKGLVSLRDLAELERLDIAKTQCWGG
jgi:Leucine-rich repeat (LRR) protein